MRVHQLEGSSIVRRCRWYGCGVQKDIEAGNVAMDHMDPNFKEGMVLVKDKYSSERRKAKILNFSLAYGKTEYGLSKDFNVTLSEAKGIVERWYKSRPEVRCPDAAVLPCHPGPRPLPGATEALSVRKADDRTSEDSFRSLVDTAARTAEEPSVCRSQSGRRW